MLDDFDPKSKADGGNRDLTQGALEAEDNLAEEIKRHEKELTDYKKANLEYLYKYSRTFQNEVAKLAKKDAEAVNAQKEYLQKKYQSAYEKNLIDRKKMEKMVALETAEYAKQLNIDNNKAVLKNLRDTSKREKKERKDKLKELKKDKSEEGKLVLTQYKKTLKEQKDEDKKLKKDARDNIMKSAENKQEGYQARLAADPYDLQAQAMVHMNEALNSFVNGIKELLNSYIQDYSSYQGKVNARLQGSGLGWNDVNNRLNNSVGATPYVKLSELLKNVSAAVEAGIAYNVEQRAFLQTVSENIATTFDAFNANLLRIVRLQQNDSTAARVGLEASLTTLFNTYFSDTSYLSDSFDSVSASLTEAIAQMGTEEGVAFEYVVQKWLGSLYSVGMSSNAVSSIATALGQLGSGDVSGLAGSSAMQNLIVMAASRAGLSYADMLTGGLTAETTNTLLSSMVDYLQEIAESDNKVIKSQYSQIFGLTSADLVAAKNLGETVSSLAQNTLDYSGAINELYYQMNQLPTRLSVGEMTGNLIDNVKYTLAQGIANNPVTYALWEMTDMIEELSGGLQLPTTGALGNFFQLNTSLTNLARLGIAGVGLLGNIGTIVNGVGNTFNPSGMLTQLGITTSAANNTVTRGGGLRRRQAVTNQVSSSTTVGNTSGEDYEASLTAQAKDKEDSMVEAKQEEEQTKSINDIHEYLLQVFDPKITGITKMLGILSGTDVSKGADWGSFKTKDDVSYSATSVKIENIGETSMASQNAEYMKKISSNVENIYSLLSKGELKVTVANYGLTGGNATTSGGGAGF